MRPPAGFTARPAAYDDAGAAAALMSAVDAVYLDDPDVTDAAEVGGWWRRLDLATDSALVLDETGAVAAVATLDSRSERELDLDAYVHPGHAGRGIGGALLDWLEDEAVRRGRPVVRTAALAADTAAAALITGRGFEPVRHFHRMLIDLDGEPPAASWPAGFEASPLRPGEETLLHAVTEEAFADHWGHEPRTLDDWQTTTFGQEWWDPSLVYLVRRDGREVVAAAINAIRFGMGWIGTLGTLPAWRGRGLGRALLLTAFGELYRRGERRVGLAVDSGNETGATHLYESAGMRVAWQADVYERRL